jgi:hypothetical protein
MDAATVMVSNAFDFSPNGLVRLASYPDESFAFRGAR